MRLGSPLMPPTSASAFLFAAASASLASSSAFFFYKRGIHYYNGSLLCDICWQSKTIAGMQMHICLTCFVLPSHRHPKFGVPKLFSQPLCLVWVLANIDVIKGISLINGPQLQTGRRYRQLNYVIRAPSFNPPRFLPDTPQRRRHQSIQCCSVAQGPHDGPG